DGTARPGLQSHARHEHHRHPAADGGNAGVGAVAEPPRRLLQPLQEQVKTERAAKPGKWARIITSARLRRIYASTRPFLHNQDPKRSFRSVSALPQADCPMLI